VPGEELAALRIADDVVRGTGEIAHVREAARWRFVVIAEVDASRDRGLAEALEGIVEAGERRDTGHRGQG
jgi:hypothetical protein